MYPILIGLGSAVLFGSFAYATYGLQGMTHFDWIGMVLGALIAASLLVYAVNQKIACFLCRHRKRIRMFERLCKTYAPCS